MKDADDLQLLRPIEVAKLLGVSRSEVYRLLALGRLPSIRLSERVVRIPRHALAELIRKGTEARA